MVEFRPLDERPLVCLKCDRTVRGTWSFQITFLLVFTFFWHATIREFPLFLLSYNLLLQIRVVVFSNFIFCYGKCLLL